MTLLQTEILKIQNLSIGYGSHKNALILMSDINESVQEGEMIALIGRNGIGKSTLIRTISGLQTPLSGNIILKGRNIKEYSVTSRARELGYISTEPVRVQDMRVYDLIALGRFPHTGWFGTIDRENHKKIMESAARAGISSMIYRPLNELSDGEYQRAMIARVIAQDSSLMLLDEPTAFLDIRSKFEILSLLYDLSRKQKKAILYTTHDLETAAGISDRIWLLLDGKILEGAPEDLYLSGQIRNLFISPSVDIEFKNGSFVLRRHTAGKVSVIGEGVFKFWTERAMERIGFEPCDQNSSFKVFTPTETRPKWTIKYGSDEYEFDSLYLLTQWITARNQENING